MGLITDLIEQECDYDNQTGRILLVEQAELAIKKAIAKEGRGLIREKEDVLKFTDGVYINETIRQRKRIEIKTVKELLRRIKKM